MFVHKNVGNRVEGLCSIQYFRKGPNCYSLGDTILGIIIICKGEKMRVTFVFCFSLIFPF